MKKSNKIGKAKKIALVVLGLIAAVLLFIQQPIVDYLQETEKADSTTTAQSEGQPEDTSSFQIMAYEVLVPVMQFNLFHSFDLLLELPLLEDTASETVESTTLVFDTFLETLFSRIISPNAP